MSSDIKTRPDNPFRLTPYWGGTRMGECIQVTIDIPDRLPRYLQMTETEAHALALDLLEFVERGRQQLIRRRQ